MTVEKNQAGKLVVDDELMQIAKDLEFARANAKRWGEIASEKRDEILELMDEHETLEAITASGTPIVVISESHRKTLDKELLAAAHPEIDLDQFTKHSMSKSVIVKNVL